MRKRSMLFALIFGLMVTIGCGDDNPAEPEMESIVGSWERIGVTLTFEEDGTYTAGDEDDPMAVEGTYAIIGDQITLIDSGCGADEGMYTFAIDDDILTFTLLHDECERGGVIPGDWTRV